MPRIRSTHPGQWTDDEFVCCSPLTRLLVLGLRNEADDNGIFEWNPVKLKMRLLPADNCDVATLLEEARVNNQIAPFDAGGRRFGIIRNFHRFQKIKKPTFQYPIPEPVPNGYELNQAYIRNGTEPVPDEYPTGSGYSPLREEVRGRREDGGGREKKAHAPDLPNWLNREAWSEWEKHRREKRNAITPSALKAQLKFLDKHREEHVQIIEQSIRCGWLGLFPLKNNGNSKQSGRKTFADYHPEKKHAPASAIDSTAKRID